METVWIIIKFMASLIAVFSTILFVLSTISSIINPEFKTLENDKVIESGSNFRYVLAIVMSITWACVIALP